MSDRDLGQLEAKLVDEPKDLAELQALLGKAGGRIRMARRGVGDEVLLKIQPVAQDTAGDWRVASQASDWVLASPTAFLAGAYATSGDVDTALASLEGAHIARLEVTDALGLVCVFDDRRWLEIEGSRPDSEEQDDDPPYWEVLTPADELVRAGPGPIWIRSPAEAPTTSVSRGVELAQLPVDDLLSLWSGVTAELRRRGVVRTAHGALSDIAEELVRKHFGGFRGAYAAAGWDVLTEDGERIQVKALQRREGQPGALMVGVPHDEFDSIVVVVFDAGLVPSDAWQIPRDVVMAHVGQSANRDRKHRLSLRRVVADPSVKRLALR